MLRYCSMRGVRKPNNAADPRAMIDKPRLSLRHHLLRSDSSFYVFLRSGDFGSHAGLQTFPELFVKNTDLVPCPARRRSPKSISASRLRAEIEILKTYCSPQSIREGAANVRLLSSGANGAKAHCCNGPGARWIRDLLRDNHVQHFGCQ